MLGAKVLHYRDLIIVGCVALLLSAACLAQSGSRSMLYKFGFWGTLTTPTEKWIFVQGFTNGFFAGPRSRKFLTLVNCMQENLTDEQTVAMIDKYYNANPEKWSVPAATGIVWAITVKDGPCSGKDPWD